MDMKRNTVVHRRPGSACMGLGLGLLSSVAVIGVAGAAEISRERLSRSTDVAHCAEHGPGWVRVDGTEACARIGERMRVDMHVPRPPPFLGGFPPPFEMDFSDDGPARARLRLDGAPPPTLPRDPNRTITR